jgi:hypothetical protein
MEITHPERNRLFETREAKLEALAAATRDPIDTMPAGSFDSSNVHSGLYDFGERTLFMRYLRDGADAIYRYDDVPAREWQGLVAAASKGSYVNAEIAFDYRYTKLTSGSLPDETDRFDGDPRVRRFVTQA